MAQEQIASQLVPMVLIGLVKTVLVFWQLVLVPLMEMDYGLLRDSIQTQSQQVLIQILGLEEAIQQVVFFLQLDMELPTEMVCGLLLEQVEIALQQVQMDLHG